MTKGVEILGCFLILQGIIGLLQAAAIFGACTGLLVGGDWMVENIVYFLILCVVQGAIMLVLGVFKKASDE